MAPLVLEGFNLGKISVGPPYFEIAFMFPMIPLVFAVGVGMHTAWRSADGDRLFARLRWPAVIALVAGIGGPWVVYGSQGVLTAVGVAAGLWLVISAVLDPVARLFGRGPRLTRGMYGMQLAHFGLGLFVLGVTVVSTYNVETDQRLAIGETIEVSDFKVTFQDLQAVEGANYQATRAEMHLQRGDRSVAVLYPEKRVYRVQQSPMTEAAIDGRWHRDVFIALGDDLGAGAWSVRIQYKPLIRFIWFGCLLMALGGLIAISDPRYRRARQTADAGADTASAGAA
jgi:cytochrome c-type biogenesis protein CcmF